jgi:tyrosinase
METLRHSDFEDLNPNSPFSRRIFIKGLGFVSVALLLGSLGGCDQLADAIKNRPTRRRLRTGSADVDADIDTYKQGVSLMKGLDSSNPGDQRGWLNQAAIHGVPAHFNFCEHGTDHFFDWHRAYLLNFERIIQKLTGKPKFGLPYWNWNQNPDIHPAFLDQTSPLFLARSRTSMSGSSSITTATLDPIMGDTNFFTFSTQIEGTPHNNVHSFIGGTLGSFASARDPLFWMHHCMIDYCWAKWNIDLNNNNTNDATWSNHVNSHYVDADGNPTDSTAAITTIMPLLSYQYESSAIGSSPANAALVSKAAYEKVVARVRAGANIRFDIKHRIRLSEAARVSIAKPLALETKLGPQDFATIINSNAATDRIFASIQYANLPATSDFSVRVFVNLPSATSSTPIEDPHYAGSFAFFGVPAPGAAPAASPTPTPAARAATPAGRTAPPAPSPSPATTPSEHTHPARFLVNLTNTIQRLRSSGELKEGTPLTLQLVAAPFAGKFEREDTQLELRGIEIVITPVIINPAPQ